MTTKEIIRSQYQAALEMLAQAIIQCPQRIWADPQDKNQFWHIAYHALFYTHLYLQVSEDEFLPWEKHIKDIHSLGSHPQSPQDEAANRDPYSKDDLLAYVDFCQQEIDDKVAALNLEAESGFDWIPFNKLELQFYNIRHLQHHTGELCERLGARAGIDVRWVGRVHEDNGT
jgi:hypothetical protein